MAKAVALLRQLGCHVCTLSQGRSTRQSPGLADCYVFPPGGRAPFWYEAKTKTGVHSGKQQEFQRRCAEGGVAYVLGGVAEVSTHLQQIGLLTFPYQPAA